MTVGGVTEDAGTAGAAGKGDAVAALGAGGTALTGAAASGSTLGVVTLDAGALDAGVLGGGALGGGAAGIVTGGLCAAARSAVDRADAPVLPVGAGGASVAEAELSLDLAGPVAAVGVACAPNPLSTARKFVAVTASEESGEPELAGAALVLAAAVLLALAVEAVGTFLSAMCCSLG
jgi:hypothetical protein